MKNIRNYAFIGIRALADDETYEVGDACRDSYEWDYENDCSTYYTTGESANGTCAVRVDTDDDDTDEQISEKINEIVKNMNYVGDYVLIGGDSYNLDGAFDNDQEIRIIDATVIKKF